MIDNLSWSKIRELKPDNVTCLVMKDSQSFLAYESGILPLMRWLALDNKFFKDATVIDKVIGKAAALLLVLGGVKKIYTLLISEIALDYLLKNQIEVIYLEKVPFIINRSKTGGCPMEQKTMHIEDPQEAYSILKEVVRI